MRSKCSCTGSQAAPRKEEGREKERKKERQDRACDRQTNRPRGREREEEGKVIVISKTNSTTTLSLNSYF